MSRKKGMLFLLGAVTLGTTMLWPQAAGAADAVRTDQSSSIVAPTSRQVSPAGDLKGLVDCPDGYHLVPFQMPIYDSDGLFVVGWETKWYCVPDDLEPAG